MEKQPDEPPLSLPVVVYGQTTVPGPELLAELCARWPNHTVMACPLAGPALAALGAFAVHSGYKVRAFRGLWWPHAEPATPNEGERPYDKLPGSAQGMMAVGLKAGSPTLCQWRHGLAFSTLYGRALRMGEVKSNEVAVLSRKSQHGLEPMTPAALSVADWLPIRAVLDGKPLNVMVLSAARHEDAGRLLAFLNVMRVGGRLVSTASAILAGQAALVYRHDRVYRVPLVTQEHLK